MYCSASATLRIKSSCLIVAITNCLLRIIPLPHFTCAAAPLAERWLCLHPHPESNQHKTKRVQRTLSPHPFKVGQCLLDLSEPIHQADIDPEVVLDRALWPVGQIQRIQPEERTHVGWR